MHAIDLQLSVKDLMTKYTRIMLVMLDINDMI